MRKIFILIIMSIFLVTGCSNVNTNATTMSLKDIASKEKLVENIKNKNIDDLLDIYILDVEQADAMLIKYKEHNILIDAGDNDDEEKMVSYLKEANVDKLDFVIATHCDADHIGGMDSVIQNFKIDTFYMTEDSKDTKTFKDMVNALNKNKVKVIKPKQNINVDIGEVDFMIIPPIKIHEDANDNSIVLKLDYNDFEMLFTGDMEKDEEKELINQNIDLDVDVLKVGHHGSRTSSTQELLDKTTPEYAFISVGEGNDYGHPHKETIDRLNKNKISYYRTDENGTMLIETDGQNIDIFSQKELGQKNINKTTQNEKYIGNKNSKVYHLDTCTSLPKEENRVYFKTESLAKKKGYSPCSKCIG